MNRYLGNKLAVLRKNKQLMALCASVVIVLLITVALTFGSSNGSHKITGTSTAAVLAASTSKSSPTDISKSNTSSDSTTTSTAPSNQNTSSATTAVATSSPTAATSTSTPTVIKTTTNNDGTTTKQIASNESVAFASQTQNEVNLKRGTSKITAGQTGVKTTIYSVIYDQNGKELSRTTVSSSVTTQPVTQVTKIGVSDFNLNTDTWDGTEFGEICFPTDYNASVDGCVGVASDLQFGAVQISGVHYVSCISNANACKGVVVSLLPVLTVQSNNTFTYQGSVYLTDPRAGGGETQLLTASICAQYGLACGSW